MRVRLAPLLLVGILLGGCHAPDAGGGDATLTIAGDQYDAAHDAAADVLRDRGFTLDRRDHRFGVVTTEPQDVPTVAEPWRPAYPRADEALAATLHHRRRVVRIELDPPESDTADAEADAYTLYVEALIEQDEVPIRRLTGSVSRNVFSHLDDVPAQWRRRGIGRRYWRPIGRDERLERQLASAIADRLALPDAPSAR